MDVHTEGGAREPCAIYSFAYAFGPPPVCHAAGGDSLGNHDGVGRILEILRNYFDPEAVDAIHQQASRFTKFRRAEQSSDEFIVEFDLLTRRAESKMGMGQGSPGQFISKLRWNHAGFPSQEKSLVAASSHESFKFDEVVAITRRLFGSRGGSGRQDVLITEEAVGPGYVCGVQGSTEPWGGQEKGGWRSQTRRGKSTRGRANIEWFLPSRGPA